MRNVTFSTSRSYSPALTVPIGDSPRVCLSACGCINGLRSPCARYAGHRHAGVMHAVASVLSALSSSHFAFTMRRHPSTSSFVSYCAIRRMKPHPSLDSGDGASAQHLTGSSRELPLGLVRSPAMTVSDRGASGGSHGELPSEDRGP